MRLLNTALSTELHLKAGIQSTIKPTVGVVAVFWDYFVSHITNKTIHSVCKGWSVDTETFMLWGHCVWNCSIGYWSFMRNRS